MKKIALVLFLLTAACDKLPQNAYEYSSKQLHPDEYAMKLEGKPGVKLDYLYDEMWKHSAELCKPHPHYRLRDRRVETFYKENSPNPDKPDVEHYLLKTEVECIDKF